MHLITLLIHLIMFLTRSSKAPPRGTAKRGPSTPSRRKPARGKTPTLYPGLSPEELCGFLTDEEHARLQSLPIVLVHPVAGAGASREERDLGVGVQRLLIRALMLIPDLSVRGPEDSPKTLFVPETEAATKRRSTFDLAGRTVVVGDRLGARFELVDAEGQRTELALEPVALEEAVPLWAAELAKAMGATPGETAREGWRKGTPPSIESLRRLGAIARRQDAKGMEKAALALHDEDRDFVLPLHLLDELKGPRLTRALEGLEADPFDAQLCFLLYCGLWTDGDFQPEAFQFLRKAIELSPGHGKAHMCAAHARCPGVDMLRHSELGYRLLPGNSFAVTNYLIALEAAGGAPADLVPLAVETIELDPENPDGHRSLVDALRATKDSKAALTAARRLERVLETMSPRTLYCLKQNPVRARELARGKARPLEEARKLVRAIEAELEA